MAIKKQITLLLSVDTEEEWDWEGPFPENNFSIENLDKLNDFQNFCEGNGLRPCYFVDYPAAKGLSKQTNFLKSVKRAGCEIGAHLHPWANPPYFDKPNEANSHVVNLPIKQVKEKLDALLHIFHEELDCHPKAFRTGRWGISEDIMNLLYLNGFDVDSSVYPFYRNEYFHCEGSPLKPYWPDLNNVLSPGEQRSILELPVTVGFNRGSFTKAAAIHDLCQKPIFQMLKLTGLLWHSKLLRKIYFSPEVTNSQDLIRVAEASIASGNYCLHMYFHSSNLLDHSTGFLKADNAFELICKRISNVAEHLQSKYDVTFMTPSEYKIYLQNNRELLAQ